MKNMLQGRVVVMLNEGVAKRSNRVIPISLTSMDNTKKR